MTHTELLAAIHYDPETGVFTRYDGGPLGRPRPGERLRFYVPGIPGPQLAHRVAVFYMTGEWPEQTDHINRDPSDNRWCNLRPCTHLENQQNKSAYKTNKLGIKGIVFNGHADPKWQRWTAKVNVDGVCLRQRCTSLEDAVEWRRLVSASLQPFAPVV